MQLLAEDSRPELSRMELIWAAGAYTAGFGEWVKLELGWRVDVPHHRARQLCGATAWRRSRAGSRSCLGGGLWSARSLG
jgi:hypothetical protein